MGMTNCGTIEETGDIVRINLGKKSDLYLTPKPSVDLILAVPRPRRLELLLPIVSCLGIRNLILIEARKVDKDYFGKHVYLYILGFLCSAWSNGAHTHRVSFTAHAGCDAFTARRGLVSSRGRLPSAGSTHQAQSQALSQQGVRRIMSTGR